MAKIVIAGGSGQLGQMLTRYYVSQGHEVVILSRHVHQDELRGVTYLLWDAKSLGDWVTSLEGADAVINLTGRSVNCRYTDANREEIISSRVDSTRVIGEALAQLDSPPQVWLQASTATIYGHHYEGENDEAEGWIGKDAPGADESWAFSVEVAKKWESEVEKVMLPKTRRVMLRSAIVLSPDEGGIWDVMRGLVSKGLGGKQGDGRQSISWIHGDDFIQALEWLRMHDEIEGAVNLSSPNPVPNEDFMRAFRKAWGISVGLPAAAWMVKFGAVFMKTEAELVLKSRRVVPRRLLEGGFRFKFTEWEDAVEDLCCKCRENKKGR